jgi:hypothetical protein
VRLARRRRLVARSQPGHPRSVRVPTRVRHDHGQRSVQRILFDTEGDDIPGGIFIEELSAEAHGPHPGFDDFCGLITPLIGP